MSPGNYLCVSRVGDREGTGEALTEWSPEKEDDSDYFKVRVLTGNPGARTYSSFRCLFFRRH